MKRMLREVSLTNKKQIIRIMMIEINSKKIIWHNVKETFKNTDQMDREIKQKYLNIRKAWSVCRTLQNFSERNQRSK